MYKRQLLSTSYAGTAIATLTTKKTGNSDYVADLAKKNMVVYNGNETVDPTIVKGTEVAMYSIDGKTISSIIVVNPTVDYMEADYVVKGDEVKIQGVKYDKDEVSGYEDLVKGDVFTFVDMADAVRYYEELAPINGQKTKYTIPTKGDAYITFADKDYEQSGLKDHEDNVPLFSKNRDTFDTDATIYLDRGGYVAYTLATADVAKYAMVIDSYSVLGEKHNTIEYYVNLLLTDGTETGYVQVDHDKYDGAVRFTNVALVNYNKNYTGSPKATGNYIDLGVLVKYTVKDGVYTLTDAAETDGADLTVAYVQGAATMKIANKNYAVTDGSIVFYQYKEETAADKFTAHYGVNVGKYDAKNNETGIPGYYKDVDVDYLETDKDDDEVLEAAVLGYLPAVWYDDYAYISVSYTHLTLPTT